MGWKLRPHTYVLVHATPPLVQRGPSRSIAVCFQPSTTACTWIHDAPPGAQHDEARHETRVSKRLHARFEHEKLQQDARVPLAPSSIRSTAKHGDLQTRKSAAREAERARQTALDACSSFPTSDPPLQTYRYLDRDLRRCNRYLRWISIGSSRDVDAKDTEVSMFESRRSPGNRDGKGKRYRWG